MLSKAAVSVRGTTVSPTLQGSPQRVAPRAHERFETLRVYEEMNGGRTSHRPSGPYSSASRRSASRMSGSSPTPLVDDDEHVLDLQDLGTVADRVSHRRARALSAIDEPP